FFLNNCHRLRGINSFKYSKALKLQKQSQYLANPRLIIDQQYPVRFVLHHNVLSMEKVSDTASAGTKVSREDTFFFKLKANILLCSTLLILNFLPQPGSGALALSD